MLIQLKTTASAHIILQGKGHEPQIVLYNANSSLLFSKIFNVLGKTRLHNVFLETKPYKSNLI